MANGHGDGEYLMHMVPIVMTVAVFIFIATTIALLVDDYEWFKNK